MASDDARLASHRERLQQLYDEALDALGRRDLARDDEERGDGHHHPAEAATDADLRERDLHGQLLWREREARLRAALEAVEAGTYGVCVDCGGAIPDRRLRAVPDAVRCVPCQTRASRLR